MAARATLTPFRVGAKELYLPNFTLTFLRTPSRPANEAKFIVPLWFSKLDLRDYLYHAYNVRILSVRSSVKQSRVIEGDPKLSRPQPNRWHRPRSTKFMTVELERPFVWPEEPEDFSPWNKEEMEDSEADTEKLRENMGPRSDAVVNEERRKAMKEQAKELLEGRAKWKPMPGQKKTTGRMVNR